ncbi:hypothetical protein GCM10028808_19120 [Spirosoma migulaei]
MRSLFFVSCLIWIYLTPLSLRAQGVDKELTYAVSILVDDKPIDIVKGIPITAKNVCISGQLSTKSRQEHPELNPDVEINKATISLVRGAERVSFIDWAGNEPLAIVLSKKAKAGDRYVIQFDEVSAQTSQGAAQKLNGNRVYQFSLY